MAPGRVQPLACEQASLNGAVGRKTAASKAARVTWVTGPGLAAVRHVPGGVPETSAGCGLIIVPN
jgi:hypothetical protein